MTIIQAIILGLVQGATEFIPVSSSGHLVLIPWLLGWAEPGLLFDTMVHWGTLLAVLVYFWRDWLAIISAWLRGLVQWDWSDPQARLAWWIALGSVPAVIAGFLLEDFFESLFSEPMWVSVFMLVTALLLTLAERLGRRIRQMDSLNWRDVLLIGVGQAAAIAPGISRSGATISAGMLRGLDRPPAARFSFLLGTPAILGAGLLQLPDLFGQPKPAGAVGVVIIGMAVAAITGYLCIWGLLRYLQHRTLYIFAAYCALVGLACLAIAIARG